MKLQHFMELLTQVCLHILRFPILGLRLDHIALREIGHPIVEDNLVAHDPEEIHPLGPARSFVNLVEILKDLIEDARK